MNSVPVAARQLSGEPAPSACTIVQAVMRRWNLSENQALPLGINDTLILPSHASKRMA